MIYFFIALYCIFAFVVGFLIIETKEDIYDIRNIAYILFWPISFVIELIRSINENRNRGKFKK